MAKGNLVGTGDLVFNMMRAWQGAIGTTKVEGMISPAYISAIPSSEIYPPFMNYLLRRKKVINQINNLSYGITAFRKRLYWDSFIRIVCKIPSISEQKRITEIFEKRGYCVNNAILDASDYGVPQKRLRNFFIITRNIPFDMRNHFFF